MSRRVTWRRPVVVHARVGVTTMCGKSPLGFGGAPLDGVHSVPAERYDEVSCRTCIRCLRAAARRAEQT